MATPEYFHQHAGLTVANSTAANYGEAFVLQIPAVTSETGGRNQLGVTGFTGHKLRWGRFLKSAEGRPSAALQITHTVLLYFTVCLHCVEPPLLSSPLLSSLSPNPSLAPSLSTWNPAICFQMSRDARSAGPWTGFFCKSSALFFSSYFYCRNKQKKKQKNNRRERFTADAAAPSPPRALHQTGTWIQPRSSRLSPSGISSMLLRHCRSGFLLLSGGSKPSDASSSSCWCWLLRSTLENCTKRMLTKTT